MFSLIKLTFIIQLLYLQIWYKIKLFFTLIIQTLHLLLGQNETKTEEPPIEEPPSKENVIYYLLQFFSIKTF